MLNQKKMRCFIHQESTITDKKIVKEDASIEITKDAILVGQNLIRKRIVYMLHESLTMIYKYMNN